MRRKTSHEAIQNFLKQALPGTQLEKNFTEIGRIADVVYFPKKIIYEVQCSSIDLQEVIKRNRDYKSIGFHVIWILHDRHFNKTFVPPAELYLRKRGAYYTSLTPHGYGFFYDQLDFFEGALRVYKGKPLVLKNFLPTKISSIPNSYPDFLKTRLQHQPYSLAGDLTSTFDIKEAKRLEKLYTPKPSLKGWFSKHWNALLMKNAGPDVLSSKHIPLEGENRVEFQGKVPD